MKSIKETKKGFSRRDFIRTTAAGVGATVLAGSGVRDSNAKDLSTIEKWDYEADVVVVGYGGVCCNARV